MLEKICGYVNPCSGHTAACSAALHDYINTVLIIWYTYFTVCISLECCKALGLLTDSSIAFLLCPNMSGITVQFKLSFPLRWTEQSKWNTRNSTRKEVPKTAQKYDVINGIIISNPNEDDSSGDKEDEMKSSGDINWDCCNSEVLYLLN